MAVSTAHPKVLVAGGAGYIGSHTCKALAAGGFLPVVYDNLSTGHRGFVRWGPLVEGDLLDQRTFEHTFAEHRPVACTLPRVRMSASLSRIRPGTTATMSSVRCVCWMPPVRRGNGHP